MSVTRVTVKTPEGEVLADYKTDDSGSRWPGQALGPKSLYALNNEVHAARKKFPGNELLTIALGEEFGELCQAQLQRKSRDEIRKEALQVACVAMRIYEEGDASLDSVTDAQSLA